MEQLVLTGSILGLIAEITNFMVLDALHYYGEVYVK